MTPEQKIKAKVKAREDAKMIREMLSWEDGTGHQYAETLLKELRSMLPMREADKPKEPQKPEPIARLGAAKLHFGQFSGQPLDEIPLERLDWYLNHSEKTVKLLKTYLTHPELASRRPEAATLGGL